MKTYDGSDYQHQGEAMYETAGLGDAQFSVRQLVDESGSLVLTRTLRPCSVQAYEPKRPYTLNPYLSLIFLGPLVLVSRRRIKGKKRYGTIWLLAGFSLTIALIGCGGESSVGNRIG